MELLDDLVDWLASQCSLAAGETLFAGAFAQDSGYDPQARVMSTSGPARGVSPSMPATFQITTRAKDYSEASGLAWTLYNAIYPAPARLPLRMVDLSADWRALAIDAIQPPYDLGLSEADLHEFVFNIQVKAAFIGVQMES